MIRIVTDSASDITRAEARAMNVDVVPLRVTFPDLAYDQETDTDYYTFYSLLQTTKKFPVTSQPTPEAFAKVFSKAREDKETVVAVLMSGSLSGTFQSATIARDSVGSDDIYLIDSRTAIMPLRILVEHAVNLRDQGKSAQEIVQSLEALRNRVKVYGMLDTLTYLYKGGRLPRSVAMVGNLLHIKPIVTTRDGLIKLAGQGRGYKALQTHVDKGPGIDTSYPVYYGYSVNDANCKKLMENANACYGVSETGMFPIGGVVGAHVGPNGFAISYVEKEG